jgi:hypothetical protein
MAIVHTIIAPTVQNSLASETCEVFWWKSPYAPVIMECNLADVLYLVQVIFDIAGRGELRYLQRRSAEWCPTRASKSGSFITSGFINIYKVIRLKVGQAMQVIGSQIRILLSCALSSSHFRPTFRNKGSSDAGGSDQRLELIPQKVSHLVEIEPWLF